MLAHVPQGISPSDDAVCVPLGLDTNHNGFGTLWPRIRQTDTLEVAVPKRLQKMQLNVGAGPYKEKAQQQQLSGTKGQMLCTSNRMCRIPGEVVAVAGILLRTTSGHPFNE